MKPTNISWTDYTWNVGVGCSKVDKDCLFCYMFRDSLNGTRYQPNQVVRTKTVFNKPYSIKEPSKIFTSSLTDFFHPAIDSYRNEIWDIIRNCPQHTFQILTKRPERIPNCLPDDWGKGWQNVWLGTSIGSMESISRAYKLLEVQSKCYFLSLEPLHGAIDLIGADLLHSDWRNRVTLGRYIDWVIVGGESGNENGNYRYRKCKIEWIEDIAAACVFNKTPVFVKQMGTYVSKQMQLSDRHGTILEEFPENLQFREFPKLD